MSDNQLPILRQENVMLIAKDAPKTYDSNLLSSQKCNEAGEALLRKIKQFGMTDDLDLQCAQYLEKTKRTLKVMNERRSPFTKLFDQIRSEFTSMENLVDSTKKDTVPYKIQQARNTYAAKKREEIERQRQEELRRQQHETALKKYGQDVEDDIRRQFDQLVVKDLNFISALNQNLTTDNYPSTLMQLKAVSVELPKAWITSLTLCVHKPYDVTDAEASQIRQEVTERIFPDLQIQYKTEISEHKDSVSDTLPSKYAELARMAKANAAEKEKMKAELAAREAEELRRFDEERRRKEEETKAARQVKQQATEMGNLFDMAAVATPEVYQPKTSVKRRVVVDSPDGMLAILTFWWSKEGQNLPIEELLKIFKKQITFCEKMANDKSNPETIQSPFVRYEEEVKAK